MGESPHDTVMYLYVLHFSTHLGRSQGLNKKNICKKSVDSNLFTHQCFDCKFSTADICCALFCFFSQLARRPALSEIKTNAF
jgi:hypothetical protein